MPLPPISCWNLSRGRSKGDLETAVYLQKTVATVLLVLFLSNVSRLWRLVGADIDRHATFYAT
jgi:hypothetical protein